MHSIAASSVSLAAPLLLWMQFASALSALPARSALWTNQRAIRNSRVALTAFNGGSKEINLDSGKIPASFLVNTENFEVRRDFEQMLRNAQVICA